MTKAFFVAAALATLLPGLSGSRQGLSQEEIAAAIAQGTAGKTLEKKCPGRNDNGMDIVAEGPIGRIMRAAKEAKRKKMDFTAADVTPNMAGAWLTVTAKRVEYLNSGNYAKVFTRGSAPSPADVLSRFPMSGADMAAAFDLAEFKAIPHKDVEIYAFATDAGGHSCKISDSERKALK